jgi:hypothetical protein
MRFTRHQRDMSVDLQQRTAREVVAWRRAQLTGAGFAPSTAHHLARDGRYDLHALLDLIDRGCPPELAARIVAPLDEQDEERHG